MVDQKTNFSVLGVFFKNNILKTLFLMPMTGIFSISINKCVKKCF